MAARFLFLCFRIRLERDQKETKKRPEREEKRRRKVKPGDLADFQAFFAGLPPPFPASPLCAHENDPDGFGRSVNPFRQCGMQAVVRKYD